SNFLQNKSRVNVMVLMCLFVFFLTQMNLFAFVTHNKARIYLKSDNLRKTIIEYDRIASSSRNPALVAEYSYALILAGQYDLALSQLDRAFMMNADNTDVLFFGSKILNAFELKEVALELEQRAPSWFSEEYPSLPIVNYGRGVANLKGETAINNILMSQKRYVTAVVRFSKLIEKYPLEPSVWQGYAIALEKLGAYKSSIKAVEQYIALEINEESRKIGANYKEMLKKRLPIKPTEAKLNLKGRYLVYAGGGFNHFENDTVYNLNFRAGKYLANYLDASMSCGYRGGYDDSDYNGLSLGAVGRFNFGLPVNEPVNFTLAGKMERVPAPDESFTFLISPGFSYFLEDSSVDLYFDMAFAGAYKGSTTLSVGYTVYFGKVTK
ncbi:MAG: hypothetical protein U9Q34_05430, partial [Elusimicrobiota bacterium]|nr:hypothetical protein [Elusimicrobiota bacterium]